MPIRVRLPIAVLAALTLAATSALASSDQPQGRGHDDSPAGRFDRPQDGFAPQWTRLRDGSPRDAGLDPTPIGQALDRVRSWTEPGGGNHPMFAGAVTLLVHDGVVVTRQASGYALRYADGAGTELPPQYRVPARTDTIFDLASVSKLFTSIVILQQVEAGRVELTKPVASYLPEFAANGKESITVAQLLTHTSGLPPWLPLWRDWPDKPSRILATLQVKPQATAGTSYLYSDLNMITLGVLLERVTGSTLDAVVRAGITEPLGMRDTGYNPPASVQDRVAATEYQLDRGMVRGEVHDENAWSLGGVAGHAGVFSTADDLAVLGQAILCGGSYLGKRILRPATVESMLTNYNTSFPEDAHGLGFELDQRWYMDGLAAAHTAGHTGYTGTSLVIDPASRSIAVLLTNRVHPSRSWGSNNPARRAVAQGLAQSLAVLPPHAETEWFAGLGNGRTATLTTRPLRPRGGGLSATFDAFIDTDPADALTVESSVDAGATWQPVTLHTRGPGAPDGAANSLSTYGHRSWWQVRADLPASASMLVRWRYTTADQYSGRGVYLSDIVIRDSSDVLVDGDPDALVASGWRLAAH